jgi:uncharacterized phage protein (TIGR01671 family)
MNRVIKFRAWDKLQVLMILPDYADWEDFFIEPNGDVFVSYDSSTNWSSYRDRRKVDLVVMQFTGLTDKNGKEIYEGDIVKRFTGYVFEVKIREYSLGAINNSKAFGYDLHPLDEVIGNIYQNPELLK